MRSDEVAVCGLAAVRALFARHGNEIKRLYFDQATSRQVGIITRVLASSKKVYRVVEPLELEKISGTTHHGGIVAVIAARPLRPPRPEEPAGWARRREPLLLLDRIGNAHNLGALVRTAAWFGVPRLVLPEHPQAARPGEAAWRVAEGGMEGVEFFLVQNLAGFCRELAPHYDVVGASLRGKELQPARGPRRVEPGAPAAKPVALVLGNEEHGLAEDVAAACTRLVKIPGTEAVESLNVAAAAAVFMWEFFGRPAR